MSRARQAATDAPAISLTDVRFAHPGGTFSLSIPSLEVAAGERVACIGPSGSGKTTLVDLIAGIRLPDAGRVEVGRVEVSALGDDQRRARRIAGIGMVFQEFELLDYLTARENVLLPYHVSDALTLDAASVARAEELARTMGIDHVLGRGPRGLSQGERQRVAVCRALVTRPGLLLCDEATGNLDPATAGDTLDLLFGQAEELGATVFLVTHDHGLLDRFDRVVDMAELVR